MKVTNKAALYVFVGASGSGKSHAMKQQLTEQRPARLIVCDPDREYSKFGQVTTDLATVRKMIAAPTYAIVFQPSDDRDTGIAQFAALCARAWHQANDQGRDLTFVVDELGEFVTAHVAPAVWRRLVKRGRKYGVTVYAGSQRPAEIDKTIWGNASYIRTGRLNGEADQVTVARAIGAPAADITRLSGYAWLSLDRNTGKRRQGV